MNKSVQRITSFVLVICLLLSAMFVNFNSTSIVKAAVKNSVASAFENAVGATPEGYRYNFDSDSSGTNLITGRTSFKDKISTDVGNSTSFMKVTSGKAARLEGFTQFYTHNRWSCASSISFDLKMASSSEDFSGFYVKYGEEIPSGTPKNWLFYSNDGVRGDSANSTTGNTGIGFSFRTINNRTCIEIFVKYLDSNGKLAVSSQFFYDAVESLYTFNKYKITDDNAGTVKFYVNDSLLTTLVCSNAKVPTRNSSYKERYYNTVKILDKNNSTLATVSHALVSTESALAFGTRNEILELDNLSILETASSVPAVDGMGVALSNNISVQYLVVKSKFDGGGFTDPKLHIDFDGQSYDLTAVTQLVSEIPCYVFSFNDISPQMMTDKMSVTISGVKDGKVCNSVAKDYSVAEYVYSQLASTTSPKTRRLLVDMLKYGTAAQKFSNYNTSEFADADLTTKQSSWGTQELREFKDSASAPSSVGEVSWLGMGLDIEEIVGIAGWFDVSSTEGLYVKVTDENHNVLHTIYENDFMSVSGPNGTPVNMFKFDALTANQMSKVFGFTVYNAQGKDISGTYKYSIESYVKQCQSLTTNTNIIELLSAMMIYGDSVYNYVTVTDEPVIEEKAKVILICGQSNAAGVSPIMYIQSAVGAQRAQKFTSGFSNVKIIYNVSTTGSEKNYNETLEVVRAGQGWHNNRQYFGPELGIAEYLSEAYPNEKFYIVKHAIGSSTIGDYMPNDPISDFISGVTDTVKYNSYGELKRIFDVAVPQIKADSGLEPEVVGVCWVQGESEAAMGDAFANTYKARQEKLISNFRRDYAAYAPASGIAFFDATIANTVAPGNTTPVWPLYAKVNAAKNQIAAADDMCFIVDVNANGVVCSGVPDYYHYDAASMIKLGRLFGANIVTAINTN